MIRSLRRRAMVMSQVLLFAALLGSFIGLGMRKKVPTLPRMTYVLQVQPPAGRQIWQQDTGGDPALSAAVWVEEARLTLTLEFAQQPLYADALVYWQVDGAGDEARRLLGPLAGGRQSVFALPNEVGLADGRVVLYSLAHGEQLTAFPLPQQDLGTLPAQQEEPQ